MGAPELLPCPHCGCTTIRSFHVFGSGRYRVDCNACNGGFEANDRERAIALWNRRSDRAGLLAELTELVNAVDAASAERGEDVVDYAFLKPIRARIAALEEEK